MNNYTLESFINFCDDMQISEEATTITNIKNAVINALKKILDKITEIIIKFTKNKNIDIDADFYDTYSSAEYSLIYFYNRLRETDDFSNVRKYGLTDAAVNITKLKEMSAIPSESRKSINTYVIFKKMVETKEEIKRELSMWERLSDIDYSEDKFHKYVMEYLNRKVELYGIVYSKIKGLK